MPYRDRFIEEISSKDEGSRMTLAGRLSYVRDHGGILFAHLADATGELQVRFDPSTISGLDVRLEDWVSVHGELLPRPEGTDNSSVALPYHELNVLSVDITGRVSDRSSVPTLTGTISEQHAARFRPYALRHRDYQAALRARARIVGAMREYLDANHFCEIETPILAAPAPEGARDFLVPSRLHPGNAYALPQSPQMYKQLLMVGGFDRYYQVARCFRDEDLRANRQPEFTQLDLEMSFVDEDEVIGTVTSLLKAVVERVRAALPHPDAEHRFTTLTYDEALRRFGTDSPDLRAPYELVDLSQVFHETAFEVFGQYLRAGGAVLGIPLPAADKFGRNEINRLRAWAAEHELAPPAWGDRKGSSFESAIRKHFSDAEAQALATQMEDGGQLFFVAAGTTAEARKNGGLLMTELATRANRIENECYAWVWVTGFPAFETNADGRLSPTHHPFTDITDVDSPGESDSDWLGLTSKAYDIVLNGEEIGSGSIRIHTLEKQLRVLKKLGYDRKQAFNSFGHLLAGLELGAPPHGGIAIGVDRLCAGLLQLRSIRDSIAFPKDGHGYCLLSNAPREIPNAQWAELALTRLDESET